MKKLITMSFVSVLALIVWSAACSRAPENTTNHNGMNHDSMDHNTMNHNSMPMNSNEMSRMPEMKSDPNAASAPFDLQFIDTMTAHHSDAVSMSEMALKNSKNDELKKFAQKIIDDQKKENAQMKEWRDKWFAGQPAAKNMEMPGMMDSMKQPMTADHMKKMEAMTGKDFDIHFLDMMIPHHEGAVRMAKDALGKAGHAEIKTLAEAIIKAQESEIKKMTEWKTEWSK